MKICTSSFGRATNSKSTISERTTLSGAKWLDGTVRTPWGIAEVMTDPSFGYSRVDFVWNGRHYIRTWTGKRSLTARGLATVAGRFAREVATARRKQTR